MYSLVVCQVKEVKEQEKYLTMRSSWCMPFTRPLNLLLSYYHWQSTIPGSFQVLSFRKNWNTCFVWTKLWQVNSVPILYRERGSWGLWEWEVLNRSGKEDLFIFRSWSSSVVLLISRIVFTCNIVNTAEIQICGEVLNRGRMTDRGTFIAQSSGCHSFSWFYDQRFTPTILIIHMNAVLSFPGLSSTAWTRWTAR